MFIDIKVTVDRRAVGSVRPSLVRVLVGGVADRDAHRDCMAGGLLEDPAQSLRRT
jgi:hypothetical protein